MSEIFDPRMTLNFLFRAWEGFFHQKETKIWEQSKKMEVSHTCSIFENWGCYIILGVWDEFSTMVAIELWVVRKHNSWA